MNGQFHPLILQAPPVSWLCAFPESVGNAEECTCVGTKGSSEGVRMAKRTQPSDGQVACKQGVVPSQLVPPLSDIL